MSYILDTDIFIEAKNRHYGFDFCPAFWEWLDVAKAKDVVFSIDRVCNELTDGEDELADWASKRSDTFFVGIDDKTNTAMSQIADWVQRSHHSDEAKRKFLSGADPFIIACALAHGHIIVTHESIDLAIKKRVKIPNVCNALGVPYTSPFKMLRDENAKFVLPSK